MTAYLDHDAINLETDQPAAPHPYTRVWAAALRLLLDDARQYWLEKPLRLGGQPEDGEEAFNDVLSCGPMLRQCCEWLEWEPEWVSWRFVRWCENPASN